MLYRLYRLDSVCKEVSGNTGPAVSGGTESLLPDKELPIVNRAVMVFIRARRRCKPTLNSARAGQRKRSFIGNG